jgi:acetyl esterase/lipase
LLPQTNGYSDKAATQKRRRPLGSRQARQEWEQVIRGVVTMGAPLTSNPKERVVNQSLAFFLVAGARDLLCKMVLESRAKLGDHKDPVIYREVPDMGHQYIDGKNGLPTLEELFPWIDALDRL